MNAGGVLIFEAKGYDNTNGIFDGHSNTNGYLQKPGTYFYLLEYSDGKINRRKSGYILLKY